MNRHHARVIEKMIIKRIITKALSVLESPIKRTNWYHSQCLDKSNYPTNEWYRSNDERNYDIVNIGSSSALYAFDYEAVGIKGFNWALQPQSMEFGFKVLKNFFSIIGPNGIVTIPLCPFSGLTVPRTDTTLIERYCDILDPSLIDNYKDISFAHFHPLLSKPKESIKRLIKDIPFDRNIVKCNELEDYESDAKFWINIWEKEFGIRNLSAPLSMGNKHGMEIRQKLMNDIINFCEERKLQPVIVSPPVHESLAEYFTTEFCKNYLHDFIDGLNLINIPYIHWLDPNKDYPCSLDSTDFYNSFFLNKKGAKKFTETFIEYLKDKGILSK